MVFYFTIRGRVNMDKRVLSLILAMTMVFGAVGFVSAATGNSKVDWLIENGYVQGDERGYRLNDNITRAEATKMIVEAQGLGVLASGLQGMASAFKDMSTSHWANGYVNAGTSNGMINGYPEDGTFRPSNNITYAEVIKMLVMINGDIPNTDGYTGSTWAIPYIGKAIEVGITEGVTITDYTANAVREKVFELVYNTMMKKISVDLEGYKVIVVENERVRSLDNDELGVVVLEIGNNPANASLRYEKDDEVRITLPKGLGDIESLLGKVLDITIDKNNNATKLSIDNTYTYIQGPILASDNEVLSGITAKTYNVYLEDRYSNSTDRLFRIYHNDEQYDYDEYLEEFGTYNPGTRGYQFVSDNARITVKNNKTYFIDSFSFEDIAPVKEVRRSGSEVYIYDDNENGYVARVSLDNVIGYTAKDGFKTMDISDIKAGDVVHIYDRYNAIVRQDAKSNGRFERLLEGDLYYAQISGGRYQVRETEYMMPVYSLDGNKFFTLIAYRASEDLAQLRNQNVTFFIDINNHLQSIAGDMEFEEGMVVIEEISRRNVDIMEAGGSSDTVVEEYDSIFKVIGSNTDKSLSDFSRGDLVYLFKDGDSIDEMIRIATAEDIDSYARRVAKTSKGAFDVNLRNQSTGEAWIKLNNTSGADSIILVNNNTNIFVVEVDSSRVTRVEGRTLEEVFDNVKVDSDLRAYVITESEFLGLNLGNNIRTGNSSSMAHTLIFTDYVPDVGELDYETIEVEFRFDPSRHDTIEGLDEDGRRVVRTVDRYASIPALEPGDIVTLGISKDSKQLVMEAEIRIGYDAEIFEVLEIDRYSPGRARSILLEDSKGDIEELFITRDAIVFNDIYEGDVVAFSLNSEGDIDVIISYGSR